MSLGEIYMKYLEEVQLALQHKWNPDVARIIMNFLRTDIRSKVELFLQKPKPYFVRRRHTTDGVWYILKLPTDYVLYHLYFHQGQLQESERSIVDPNTWLRRIFNSLL